MKSFEDNLIIVILLLSLLTGFGVAVQSSLLSPMGIVAVAWSPDGSKIAGGGLNGILRIWDVNSGALLRDFQGIQWAVISVAWSPDGTRIASGGGDQIIRIWEVEGASSPIATINDHDATITSVAWNPDGTLFASASHSGLEQFYLRLWDGNTYLPLAEDRGGDINAIAWNPNLSDSELAVAKENYFLTLEAITTTEIQFSGLSYKNSGAMTAVAWNSDGSLLASGDVAGKIDIWDPTNLSSISTFTGHTDRVSALVWSPDNTQLASASRDGTIRIWDVNSGQTTSVLRISSSLYTSSIDWNTTGLIFGQADSTVRIIQFPTAEVGNDELVIDTNNDGSELVTLDGSASSDPDGTITGYAWTLDAEEIATGVKPQVDLGVGVHEIILTVTDDDGATGGDIVVITVQAE